MRITYSAIHRYALRLKLGGKFLTSMTKLVLKVRASISSLIKENLFLYCCELLVLVVIVIFNMSVSKKDTA